MKRGLPILLLLLLNLTLAAFLASALTRGRATTPTQNPDLQSNVLATNESLTPAQKPTPANTALQKNMVPATPFTAIYSVDSKQFAANLRALGCPEETVKDILAAEVHRQFKEQEDALRPKPADHVPFAWSAKTTEPRLAERREKAAALFREETARLRDALGYDVFVPVPLYAQTMSDVQFQETLANSDAEKRNALQRAQDEYWTGVQLLQDRTKGFWLPQDVADLQRLKDLHQQTIASLLGNR
ncbi:MAG TPA: hypothetical protein VLT36_19660 [Candidatus Dormibacteraeota bacterium]|nr:hypothetical protein [Candidatus Dormibacteraeota bacterium]